MTTKKRLSKSEREDALKAQRAAEVEIEKAKYPHRLMAVLEFADSSGWTTRVRDNRFIVIPDMDNQVYISDCGMGIAWDEVGQRCLEEVEIAIKVKRHEDEMEAERRRLRAQAMEKLTPEEKKALGLC